MPVCVEKQGKKFRIVNCSNRKIEVNNNGTPVDGGGHDNKQDALRQAAAINAHLEDK